MKLFFLSYFIAGFFMRSRFVPLFISITLFAGCSSFWFFGEEDDFVRVQGAQFVHNGTPYYFAGTNLWYGCNLGSPGETGNRARLLRELDSLHAHGLDNLRILAGSEMTERAYTVKPAIVKKPGEYDEELLVGLDFLLDEMAKRKMKGVLYLTNYWEWSGGMTQYIAWADGTPAYDPEVQGWKHYMNTSATFYTNNKANELLRNYIKYIVRRKNSVSGKYYSEDPTIMAWQLANEPRPGWTDSLFTNTFEQYYQWVDEASTYIKSLDTNHLVSTGNEGLKGSLESEECYLTAHQYKSIDYMTMHLWPLNWGWYNPLKAEETYPTSEAKAIEYINQHILYARRLNKPLVMEEFGIGRDSGYNAPDVPTTIRNRYYKKIFAHMYNSAQAGSPVAGSNFWTWGGEGRAQNADFMWKQGDPFTGDPPQEPQGRNSVFDADVSTLAIIKEHAIKMKRLGVVDSLMVTK
jgi:mannan endo-1,4-beta-mannosidase